MSTYHQSTVTTSIKPFACKLKRTSRVVARIGQFEFSLERCGQAVCWTPEAVVLRCKLIEMNRNIVMQFGRLYKQLRANFYEENNTSDALQFTCGQFVTQNPRRFLVALCTLLVPVCRNSGKEQVRAARSSGQGYCERDAMCRPNKLLLDTYDTLMRAALVSCPDIHRSIKSFRRKSRRSRTSRSGTTQPTPQHVASADDSRVGGSGEINASSYS